MFSSLVEEALAGFCALLAVLLLCSGIYISHEKSVIAGLQKDIATVQAQKTASDAAGAACTASVQALKQASDAQAAKLQAAQAQAASALSAAAAKPLPPTPKGCEAATAWAHSQAATISADWGAQ